MEQASKVFRFITLLGAVTVSMVLLDYLLPAKEITTVVRGGSAGIERNNRGRNLETHYRILTNDYDAFPVYSKDDLIVTVGDSVIIGESLLLQELKYLKDPQSNESVNPAIGIYSYFSITIPLLLCSTLFGFLYWNKPRKHASPVTFTFFLIGFVLFIINYY